MVQVKLPVVERIHHDKSNKFATGVENKAIGELHVKLKNVYTTIRVFIVTVAL